MTTDSFEKLFSTFSSGQTERRSQLAKDLLSLFSEEGLLNAESEEYRCVMSAIEECVHPDSYALLNTYNWHFYAHLASQARIIGRMLFLAHGRGPFHFLGEKVKNAARETQSPKLRNC